MEYLYEVAKNGLTFDKVKVAKECSKTYILDKVVDKRVYKIEGNDELAGYNTYCWYFKDETIAKNWLNSIKNRNFACKCETKTLSNENQKAIECLEEAKREFETYYADNIWNYPEWIDQKISELKGE